MNEEFIQFPRSDDDDLKSRDHADQFEKFPSEDAENIIPQDLPANPEASDDHAADEAKQMIDWFKEFSDEIENSAVYQEASDSLEPFEPVEEEPIEEAIPEEIPLDEVTLEEISQAEISADEALVETLKEETEIPAEEESLIEQASSEGRSLDVDAFETAPADESQKVIPAEEASVQGTVTPGELSVNASSEDEILPQPPAEPAEIEPEPIVIEDWLSDQMAGGNYSAVLILKGNRTWKKEGVVSRSDIKEIERAVSEAQKAGNIIDMARYVRLGEKREKYLLYVSTISGSLVLCTINFTRFPLSEIRSRTREASSRLPLTDEQVALPDAEEEQAEEMEEVAASGEHPETVLPNIGEAPQVMVNDLIRESAGVSGQPGASSQTDGWIFDNQADGDEAAHPETAHEDWIGEINHLQPETLEVTGMEESTAQPESKIPPKMVSIPKAGYSRMEIGKPIFGRLFHLSDEQLASISRTAALPPSFSGLPKPEPAQGDAQSSGSLDEHFPGWKPAYRDIVAFKRAWLKNQKPVVNVRQWILPAHQVNAADETITSAAQTELETWPETGQLPDKALSASSGEDWCIEAEKIEDEPLAPPETLLGEIAPALKTEDAPAGAAPRQDQMDTGAGQPAAGWEPSETGITETPQEDFIFLDENSEFLKPLSQDSSLEGLDQDQDAGAFFEEYFNRSGEIIEGADTEPKIFEEEDKTAKETLQASENGLPPAGTFNQPDTDEEYPSALKRSLPEKSSNSLDIDNDFNSMLIAMRERFTAAEAEKKTAQPASMSLSAADQPEAAAAGTEDFPAFLDETPKPDSAGSGMDLTEQDTAAGEFAASEEEEEHPDSQQTVLDLRRIISDALIGDTENASSEEPGDIDKFSPDHPSEEAVASTEPKKMDEILGEDLFPWEEETEKSASLEDTPTPQSWTEADQSGEALVDLLADAPLDPIHLGFDQPMYTCILVPELSEFNLTDMIAFKIREWLPRLSRVFGWQFENISVQPTWLQWTVRVPAGTSQGSIVRKIRQQTSLRIFEEFPELKTLSQSGNFWAKGYLVVAGSNPPPAEFLDDFIQKNRRPSSAENS